MPDSPTRGCPSGPALALRLRWPVAQGLGSRLSDHGGRCPAAAPSYPSRGARPGSATGSPVRPCGRAAAWACRCERLVRTLLLRLRPPPSVSIFASIAAFSHLYFRSPRYQCTPCKTTNMNGGQRGRGTGADRPSVPTSWRVRPSTEPVVAPDGARGVSRVSRIPDICVVAADR